MRSSDPSSLPRSFCRNAGWVWMNSSLTGGDRKIFDEPQVDAHAHARKQQHGLLAGDRLGRLQNAVGTADLVVQVLPPLGQEVLPRAFVLKDLGHDVGQDLDQLGLALAEGLLVRDLVEVAGGLGCPSP